MLSNPAFAYVLALLITITGLVVGLMLVTKTLLVLVSDVIRGVTDGIEGAVKGTVTVLVEELRPPAVEPPGVVDQPPDMEPPWATWDDPYPDPTDKLIPDEVTLDNAYRAASVPTGFDVRGETRA